MKLLMAKEIIKITEKTFKTQRQINKITIQSKLLEDLFHFYYRSSAVEVLNQF